MGSADAISPAGRAAREDGLRRRRAGRLVRCGWRRGVRGDGLSGVAASRRLVRMLTGSTIPPPARCWWTATTSYDGRRAVARAAAARRSRWCFSTSGCCRTAPSRTTWRSASRSRGPRRKRARSRLEGESSRRVGLGRWGSSYPDEAVWRAMQQRVGLARALATDPEIMLFDEPFSALDPLIRRDMQDEVIHLQSEVRKTMIFITHDLMEALKLGDRIAIMKDGQFVQVGTPEEVVAHPADDYVADFTRDVPRTHVLTVRTIMRPANGGATTRATSRPPTVVRRPAAGSPVEHDRPFRVVERGRRSAWSTGPPCWPRWWRATLRDGGGPSVLRPGGARTGGGRRARDIVYRRRPRWRRRGWSGRSSRRSCSSRSVSSCRRGSRRASPSMPRSRSTTSSTG